MAQALERHDIDLFVGSVTRAKAREVNGIRFTSGYLPFRTRLYVPRSTSEDDATEIRAWLSGKRRVGVIGDSTNQQLLSRLIDEFGQSRIDSHVFTSFPGLEAALDNGQIDGALVDDTLVSNPHWFALEGLQHTPAWNSYVTYYIGKKADYEEVAIATVADAADLLESDQQSAADGLAN